VASIVALASLRTLRNISSAPFSITTDCCDGYFQIPTMFRVSVSCMHIPIILHEYCEHFVEHYISPCHGTQFPCCQYTRFKTQILHAEYLEICYRGKRAT
jgi:hypothetical protein